MVDFVDGDLVRTKSSNLKLSATLGDRLGPGLHCLFVVCNGYGYIPRLPRDRRVVRRPNSRNPSERVSDPVTADDGCLGEPSHADNHDTDRFSMCRQQTSAGDAECPTRPPVVLAERPLLPHGVRDLLTRPDDNSKTGRSDRHEDPGQQPGAALPMCPVPMNSREQQGRAKSSAEKGDHPEPPHQGSRVAFHVDQSNMSWFGTDRYCRPACAPAE